MEHSTKESATISERNPSSNPCREERFVIPISLVLGGEAKGVIVCKMERHSGDRLTGGGGEERQRERNGAFWLIGFEIGQRAWSNLTGKS